MKGYYTVRAQAPGYSQGQRIALEAAFAREVEAVVGGVDRMTELCLEAASEGERGGARASLLHASKKAETAVRAVLQVPEGCRFSIGAWQATDL